jgi:DNA-binding CsgD family transcriptional regulator
MRNILHYFDMYCAILYQFIGEVNMDKAIQEQLEIIEWAVGKRKATLNTSEVAKCLGLSSSTIDSYRKQACMIEHIKPSSQGNGDKGRVLYPTLAVAKWLIKHTIKAA